MPRRKWTKEEIEEYRRLHGPLFYYNKEDANFFVPKAYGIGRTLNWANPISWVIILVIVGFVILRKYY